MSTTDGRERMPPPPLGYGHDRKGGGKGRLTERESAGITFTLDGREVVAQDGETIWQVAQRLGTDIPHLCYLPEPGYRPDGNCRACMVEVEGERVLAASCIRKPTAGMKGAASSEKIVFDFADPRGRSTCVACGECVQACPTGALMPATLVEQNNRRVGVADRTVESVCPYCGVGCQLTYHIRDDKLLYVSGRNGPANENRLCVKGRFGFDYIDHPHRLKVPLIAQQGVQIRDDDSRDSANPS